MILTLEEIVQMTEDVIYGPLIDGEVDCEIEIKGGNKFKVVHKCKCVTLESEEHRHAYEECVEKIKLYYKKGGVYEQEQEQEQEQNRAKLRTANVKISGEPS